MAYVDGSEGWGQARKLKSAGWCGLALPDEIRKTVWGPHPGPPVEVAVKVLQEPTAATVDTVARICIRLDVGKNAECLSIDAADAAAVDHRGRQLMFDGVMVCHGLRLFGRVTVEYLGQGEVVWTAWGEGTKLPGMVIDRILRLLPASKVPARLSARRVEVDGSTLSAWTDELPADELARGPIASWCMERAEHAAAMQVDATEPPGV